MPGSSREFCWASAWERWKSCRPAASSFVDKHTYPVRHFGAADGVRVVPGGSSVRSGAYVARGVVCMPPMYINAGAYVDEGTMVDSHALVGSCAQIGKRVHLSAAAQIGGVLEPVNASPVIIEDDVLVGGNCGVYEGAIVRKGAVLAAGTILTRGTPVFNLVSGEVLRATAELPLIVPEDAVVVPGSRAVAKGKGRRLGPEPLRRGDRQVPRRQNQPQHHPRRPAEVDARARCYLNGFAAAGCSAPACPTAIAAT